MDAPRFSLVVPTFNYGRYLRRAIDSALAQGGDDFELIVVDDGSTDDTPRVAASYGAQLRYYRQESSGVFEACRRGLNESRGRFLIYFDADDALAPGALARLRSEIDRRPDVGLVAGRHVTVTATGPRFSPPIRFAKSRTTNFRNFLLGRQILVTGAAAICREAVSLLLRYQGGLRVGLETACIAQTLWFYDAVALNDVLLEVHEHPGRLRDNLAEIRRAGDALVDAVFHPDILPPAAARFRECFRARLLRDRARSYYRAGLHAETVQHYRDALHSDPWRSLRDVRNLRRYAISRARQRAATAPTPLTGRASREPGVVEVQGGARGQNQRRQLRSNPQAFLRNCSALGDVVKLRLARPTYLLSDPRDIVHVFVEQAARYRRTGLQAAFRPLFGAGLFSRSGRSHIDHRRVVQPMLHRSRLDGFLPPLQETLAEVVPHWQDGQVLQVGDTITNFTLRAAGRMILGVDRPDDLADLFASVHASHQRVVRNMQSGFPLPAWLPTRRNRTLRAHVERLDAVMHRLIGQARRSDPTASLLSQLVQVRDGAGAALDDRQIRDHVLPIFVATYEPPATALMWVLHLLARHPDVQRRLQSEIDAHAREHASPSFDDASGAAAELWRRPEMAQVIAEAVRLYPSTWMMTRRAGERDVLPSGATIPRGADVLASSMLVHRDARYYDDPEAFRPERFAQGFTERRAAGTYFPFGLGPANCIGEYLARLMIAATLDAILSRFQLESCNDDEPQMQSINLFTMHPDRPISVKLSARSSAATPSIISAAA